jgi:hypothetical protein
MGAKEEQESTYVVLVKQQGVKWMNVNFGE